MKQLSGSDNVFLVQERGNQAVHVAGLAIYDPSTAPGGLVRFKQILEFFTRRLHRSKVFRRRLVRAPFDLDRPYWIDEPSIDVEYHVRHIALPQPGDWRQLMIQIARIHARHIDLTKPAWEAYIIEGLDNIENVPKGSFALYIKAHHAAIDGQAGAALIGALHSLRPDDDALSEQPTTTIADREPTTLELLARTVNHRYDQAVATVKLAGELAPLALRAGRAQFERFIGSAGQPGAAAGEKSQESSHQAPFTRFNGKLSPHRVIESLPLPLDSIAEIRKAVPGATINDVFMSVCGGALRRYLQAKSELPAETLMAFMPISSRRAEHGTDDGNQIGFVPTPICSDIADAGERLRRINAVTARGKRQVEAVGKDLTGKLFQVMPSVLAEMVVRKLILPQINLTVSNVRGPDVPLYLAGARLVCFMPVNVLLDGLGLSITGFSYNNALWVCAVADRSMMPDPAFFRQCMLDSFEEHKAIKPVEEGAPAERPVARARGKSAAEAAGKAVATPMARKAPKKAAVKAERKIAKKVGQVAAKGKVKPAPAAAPKLAAVPTPALRKPRKAKAVSPAAAKAGEGELQQKAA